MTKPLLACSIKRSKKTPALRELNLIIEEISDEVKLGHLFIVDINFNEEEASEKHLLFIEIYTPIVEKKKAVPPKESSVFQLLDAMRLNEFLQGYIRNSLNYVEKVFLSHCTPNIFIV